MSKIDFIRNEFLRIGCPSPAYVLDYRLEVEWHFSDILIRGKQIRFIDYEMLVEILRKIPKNVGEDYFWKVVNETDFEKLAKLVDKKLMDAFLKDTKSPDKKIRKNSKVKAKKTKITSLKKSFKK